MKKFFFISVCCLAFAANCFAGNELYNVRLSFVNRSTGRIFSSRSFLMITDTAGRKLQVQSDNSEFKLPLPKGRFTLEFSTLNMMPSLDYLDLDGVSVSPGETLSARYSVSEGLGVTSQQKLVNYIDAGYSLWSIGFNSSIICSVADGKVSLQDSLTAKDINWKGYCCPVAGDTTYNIDTVEKEMNAFMEDAGRLKKKKHKVDSVDMKIGNYSFTVYYNDTGFTLARTVLSFSGLPECYEKYFSLERYLSVHYENEKVDYTGNTELGSGKIYYADGRGIVLMYGIRSKNMERQASPDRPGSLMAIPAAEEYFISLELRPLSMRK